MRSRLGSLSVMALLLATVGIGTGGPARAQIGLAGGIPGYPAVSQFSAGYGSNSYGSAGYAGGFGAYPSYGYGVNNGRVGTGYGSAGRLYQQSYQAARPQTTIALQPLYSAITSLPGWNGPTHRIRRRLHTRPAPPRAALFDNSGQVKWPSSIPKDPAVVATREAAEAAVRTVVLESQSTGHASVRPVVDAKNKLSEFERQALPEVRAKNTTDANGLETFILDLDKALDAMTYVY